MHEDRKDQIEPLDIGEIAHRQIGTHLAIPAKYYAKMLTEKPGLLCDNVNSWMEEVSSKRISQSSGCSSVDTRKPNMTPLGRSEAR